MGLILTDRVKETSITSGTGSITLAGAFGGFVSFSAGIGNGNTTYYVIENGTNFEIGIGTYTEVGNTLSRDTVLSSSNSGSKIDLSGVSYVFCSYPASKAVFLDEDGQANLSVGLTIASGLEVTNSLDARGDLGVSGLLTLRRDSAGNFFHAYVDDSNDETISLYHDGTVSPDWKLGLKDSPNNSGDPPTYAYVYAGDGNIGLYSNSLTSINLTHGGGFNVTHKGNTAFESNSDTGFLATSYAASQPAFRVKGASAQSANLQEWTNSSDIVLAKVDNEGDLTARSFITTSGSSSGIIFHGNDGVLSSDSSLVYNSSDGRFGIGTDSPDYTLDVAGNIGVDQYIYHNGDTNTYIRFRGDQIDLVAGNITMLTLDEAGQDRVIVNNGKNNVDFRVEGDGDENLIYTDAAIDMVGIGTDEPAYKLDVFGHNALVRASGFIAGSSGVVITSNTPSVTTNTLYNVDGSLHFNGSSLTALSGDALPHASGDHFLTEIRTNSASGNANLPEIRANSASGNFNLVEIRTNSASGSFNLNEIRTNSASGNTNATNITANTNLVRASGDFLLGEIVVNSASGNTNSTNITSNTNLIHASGNSLLTKIIANSDSGITRNTNINNNTLSINSSGNMLLDEVRANSASGLVISGVASAGGGALPYSSGDYFLTEIRSNSASGNSNLTEIRANSASGVTNTSLVHSSGDFLLGEITVNSASGASISGYAQDYANMKVAALIDSAPATLDTLNEIAAAINDDANIATTLTNQMTANTTEVRANSASGVVISGIANSNLNAINNSGVFWLGEIQTNSASGAANLTEIRANSASGNFNLTEIRANSASGAANLTEIRANSASGNANLTEIRANSASGVVISGIANSSLNAINNSGVFWLGEIATNSASGAANLTEIRANSASGAVNAGLINNSGVFWLGEIATNSASGNFNLTEIRANSASGNFSAGSGIELHGKAFQASVSGANLLATNTPTDNYVPSYDIATGKFTWVENAGGGGGGGSMTSVKSNGSAVGGSDIVTLDFSSDFGVAETPDTEINITIGTLNQNTTGSAATLTTARAIALAGDVTGTANFDGSAGISITSTIANDAVTYAKMQDTAADNRLLGAATAGTIGEVQVATAMIADDAVTYAKMQHTGTANRVLGAASAGAIGEVQVATDMVADDAISYAKIQNVSATDRILGRDSSGAGVIEEITPANLRTMINVEDGAAADQTKSDIDGLAITTVGTLAAGDATAIVSAASTTAAGKVELATTAETTTGTDTARAVTPDGLKDGYQGSTNVTTLGTIANGTWQGTAIAHAFIGDDAIDGDNIADSAVNSEHYVDGSIDTAHIDDDQVTYAKVQNVSATSRVLGRITSGAGVIEELTGANIVSIIGTLNQDTTGSAATLTTARAIAVAGNVTGTANFDGSAGISITTTLATDAIVTANITDLNVTTGKIADNGITLAKMAGLARGSIIIGDSSGDPAALGIGSNTYVLTSDGTDIAWAAAGGGGSVAGDTFATDLKVGRDSQNLIDFATTDNKIILRANNVNQVSLIDNVFGPEADSDVDLGTTGVRWKDAYVDSITVTGNTDVDGDLDVDGTTNLDAVDIDGAVDLAGELKLTGAFVPGAGLNASTKTTSINLDLSTGNYFEVTLTSGQSPVATIVFTNAKVGQRFMIRVIQPASGGTIVLDSVADGWDTISINSDTSTDASNVACKWGGGIGPILTTGNGAADLYGFVIRGVDGSAAIDGVIIAQGLAAT